MNNTIVKRKLNILPLISLFFLIFASCRQEYFSTDGKVWGTTYHIVYSGASSLSDSIVTEMALVDNEFSMFNEGSVVSRINRNEVVRAGERFVSLFKTAKKVHELSGGVYDPTIGPLSDLWGFGITVVDSMPDEVDVIEALALVGFGECSIAENGVIYKKHHDTRFDFSSIAKGFGIDCIGRMLERNGVENYMIEIGGEVLVKGVSPRGGKWRIQIDSPEGGMSHSRMKVVELGPEISAIATSGNYRNYRIYATGGRLGHTLSPLSGYPVDSKLASVSIRANDCAYADALATACMASGSLDSARDIIEKAGVDGLIIYADESGEAAFFETEGFTE